MVNSKRSPGLLFGFNEKDIDVIIRNYELKELIKLQE